MEKLELAEAALNGDDLDGALSILDEIPEADRGVDWWELRAEALLHQDRYNEAEPAAITAIMLGSDDAYTTLGAALNGRGDHQAALAVYRRAAETDPEDPLAVHGIGCTHFHLGDYAAAAEAWRRAVEMDLGPVGAQAAERLAELEKSN